MTTDPRVVLELLKAEPRAVLESGEVPIRTEDGRYVGALVPITQSVVREPGVAALLTRWREMDQRFFFTQFVTTEERTARWLERDILGDPGRMLFFICDENGARLGHYGLTGVCEGHAELDNLIRGERGGNRRLVHYAEVALLVFAFERLDVRVVTLRAFANNVLATVIHDEIGFVLERKVPLIKEETPDGVTWKPARPGTIPERELVEMRLDRENFVRRFAWAASSRWISSEANPRAGSATERSAVHGEEARKIRTPGNLNEDCTKSSDLMAADEEVRRKTIDWINTTARHRYTYNFRWMGRPIIQFPQDIVAMQEIIWEVRPDVIVETGVAHGGSLVLYASLLELIGGDGRVVGIDIDLRPHNRIQIERHPMARRIDLIQGSSVDAQVAACVAGMARGRRTLVALDSNHTHDHVMRELELYSPLVHSGSYLIVFDTIIEEMPDGFFPDRPWKRGNNPRTAVEAFLKTNDRFEVDEEIERKLLITVAPGGYLRCVKD